VFSRIFLDEQFGSQGYAGAALILLGVWLSSTVPVTDHTITDTAPTSDTDTDTTTAPDATTISHRSSEIMIANRKAVTADAGADMETVGYDSISHIDISDRVTEAETDAGRRTVAPSTASDEVEAVAVGNAKARSELGLQIVRRQGAVEGSRD
jgi:hypothetical protein